MKKHTEKIAYLDHMKAGIILLMLLFHAAMCYMAYAPDWWYVLDTKRVLSATMFVIWADVFIMPAMFFISGYFGIRSYAKYSSADFWKKKWNRIALPWLFGVLFLAPPTAYLMFASRPNPPDFWTFYQTLFWGPYYQQSHYWYLGALLALYLLLALACSLRPALKDQTKSAPPSSLLFAGVAVIGGVSLFGMNYYIPDGLWIHPLYLLVLQPTRVPLYILYFFLGVYGWRRHWFEKDGYAPKGAAFPALFFISSILFLVVKIYPQLLGLTPLETVAYGHVLHSLLCLSAVFGLIVTFRAMRKEADFFAYFAPISYAIYYVHQPFVQGAAWMLRPLPLDAYTKYSLTCIIALSLCTLLGKILKKYFRCFGKTD